MQWVKRAIIFVIAVILFNVVFLAFMRFVLDADPDGIIGGVVALLLASLITGAIVHFKHGSSAAAKHFGLSIAGGAVALGVLFGINHIFGDTPLYFAAIAAVTHSAHELW